ncbi:MAG: PEPxxWA-CTERM sorting domain-containing protein [Sphingomonas bacterium]|nr:PEPxxWA-CTERM sorting domain-containing protein [Sphingomonas bacterium]
MRKHLLLICGVALSSVVVSVPANAQALNFNLTGSRTATFTLNSATPDSFTSSFIGDQIFFNNIVGSFGGTPGTGSISFGSNLVSDFQIQSANLGFTQLNGADLFTGPGSNPTFNLGTFNLSGGFTAGPAVLTISRAAVSAVPEPGTWAMMLIGFGAIGFAARRRRAMVTVRTV